MSEILGFQAMGQPDQERIQAFAAAYAPWIGGVAAAIATFLFALLAARKQTLPLQHGLFTGVVAATLSPVLSALTGSLSAGSLIGLAIYLAAGAAAGWLSARREPSVSEPA